METEKRIEIEKLRTEIKNLLDVSRWTIRCERALEYFMEHPEEIAKLPEYRVEITTDSRYLARKHRIGELIGIQRFGLSMEAKVFLVRDLDSPRRLRNCLNTR